MGWSDDVDLDFGKTVVDGGRCWIVFAKVKYRKGYGVRYMNMFVFPDLKI